MNEKNGLRIYGPTVTGVPTFGFSTLIFRVPMCESYRPEGLAGKCLALRRRVVITLHFLLGNLRSLWLL